MVRVYVSSLSPTFPPSPLDTSLSPRFCLFVSLSCLDTSLCLFVSHFFLTGTHTCGFDSTEWWAGLTIDSDSDDDDYGDVESKNAKFEAYYVRPEDEDYDHKLPRHDSVESENIPVTDSSVRGVNAPPSEARMARTDTDDKKGQARARRLVEMPVPDVNAKRTVNTYDPDSKRLVSVWAANYTVLMTDLVSFFHSILV